MSGLYCVDANILIAAWYASYPIDVFSSLWPQLSQHRHEMVLIEPVFDEIEPISASDRKNLSEKKKIARHPLRMWLEENSFNATGIDDNVKSLSLELEREYEISNESKGAGQTDITLIAYAKMMNKTVVTFEGKQPNKPGAKKNYKIPLICEEQGVECKNFVEMLKHLGIRI